MRARVLIALALIAAALSGCGASSSTTDDSSGDFQGEQRLVANAIEDLEAAAADDDAAKLCRELLATELVRRLEGAGAGDCGQAVTRALDSSDAVGLTVESVRLDGQRATATVTQETGDRDRRTTIGLVKQRGGWKVTTLGA